MNKILITVYVPFLNEKYDLFIPINKKIGTIKQILVNSINEMSGYSLVPKKYKLYEKSMSRLLDNNLYVNASNISNGS